MDMINLIPTNEKLKEENSNRKILTTAKKNIFVTGSAGFIGFISSTY